MSGTLVALEGIDGAGKSEMRRLMADRLIALKHPVTECGELQSPWAESIRAGLATRYTPFIKTFIFAADRAWTYERVCVPALDAGSIVLWDRYVDSAIVYRRVEMVEPTLIDGRFVRSINRPFKPADLTILLDLSVATAQERLRGAGRHEPYSTEFLDAVRAEYLRLAKRERQRFAVIDAHAPRDQVADECVAAIGEFLARRNQPCPTREPAVDDTDH